MRQLGEIVGPHEPDEARFREARVQGAQRVAGVARVQVALDVGGDDAAAARISAGGHGGGRGQAIGQRGEGLRVFQRVTRRDEQPDLVQAQASQRRPGEMQVAGVGGVEAAAEDADAHPAAVAEAGWCGHAPLSFRGLVAVRRLRSMRQICTPFGIVGKVGRNLADRKIAQSYGHQISQP